MSIKLIDVTKTFARRTGNEYVEVVRNLSLDINEGSLTLIRGPTGSGKTTLLSLISGILQPTSGDVVLNSMHSSESGDHPISIFRGRYIGYVSQDILLVPDLNCMENVLFPNVFRREPVKRLKRRAMELFERLQLSDKRTCYPFELSGGEQKKVMIVRALVSSPRYIIADEPISELDEDSSGIILALFEEYNKNGAAVVVASHAPVTFSGPYDIYMLDRGSIIHYRKGGLK